MTDFHPYDSQTTDSEEPTAPTSRRYEDLSLAEFLGYLLRHPLQAWTGLSQSLERQPVTEPIADLPDVRKARAIYATRQPRTLDWEQLKPALYMGGAFLLALIGSCILAFSRGSEQDGNLLPGGILLLAGAAILAVFASRDLELSRIPPLVREPVTHSPLDAPTTSDTVSDVVGTRRFNIEDFLYDNRLRFILAGLSVLWLLGSWIFNADNQFTTPGVICWVMSIVTLIGLFGDQDTGQRVRATYQRIRDRLRRPWTIRITWSLAILVVIMLMGAWFRFGSLSNYPPEMTSDHVEKLLDAAKVDEGQRPIFFPNNGGRESFQMYYLAVLKELSGAPFTFDMLKIGTAIEGMLMILLAYWMGRAIFGDENRELGNMTGLIMAALIAISFWHTLLSRLGLRIVTTPLVATVVFVFLVRAMRDNRRIDYLIAGFALGASMYFYQAARMLPLMVIAGVIIAIAMRSRSWATTRSYLLNFAVLVIVSLAVFLPLGRYMVENPAEFWQRTAGRLFGDAATVNADGTTQNITASERLTAFEKNIPEFTDDFVKSALLFNWKGDRSWFNGAPSGAPALDFFTGALFIIGLAVVIVRIRRRRDPADVLLPISILIMILPSALAIAFPIEVPSFTRGSGSLPMAYLVAALGLAALIQMARKRLPAGWPRRTAWIAVVILLLFAAVSNSNSYFVDAMSDYLASALPHKQAGQILAGFSNSTGAPGNAFMIAYKYWMDNRAIGIEGGEIHWPDTIVDSSNLPQAMYDQMRANENTHYAFHPDKQMLFFVNNDDTVAVTKLKEMFPDGIFMPVQAFEPTRNFQFFVAPPPGCDWAKQNLGFMPNACASILNPAGGSAMSNGLVPTASP